MIDLVKFDRAQQFYPSFTFGSWSCCTYCGKLPNSRDHVIPFSALSALDRKKHKGFCFKIGPLTPACTNCNSILSSKGFNSFLLRSKFVSDRLLRKAIKCSGNWEPEELKKFDRNLENFILEKQNLKETLFERSSWFLSESYLLNLECLISEPLLQKNHEKFNEEYFHFFSETIERVIGCLNLREEIKGSSKKYN